MSDWYKKDLAYIHDEGHGEFARRSAPGIIELLRRRRIDDGLVVDLGCGSGLWARELRAAGYEVLGIDISEAMIAIARARVPDAEFRVESFLRSNIPCCHAVTSLGECLNYLFDPKPGTQALTTLFRRIHRALAPGGLFLCDIAEPGQVPIDTVSRGFSEGANWLVAVQKEEDHAILTRRIVSFRKSGGSFRRAEEVHRLRLYKTSYLSGKLRQVGFRVRIARSYGKFALPPKHAAFIASKPFRS